MAFSKAFSMMFAATALCGSFLAISDATAQTYPGGPVRIIVPSAAGGGPDAIARLVADRLSRSWGQQVLVVNHPGAGGALAMRAAGTAAPDGRTLYFAISSNFIALPEIQKAQPYDLTRDFVPIGFVAEQPMVVGVSPSLGVNSVSELVALAKNRPGELNFAALVRGGLPHLTGELLRSASGADLTVVHYPGAPQALTDLVGGRVHVFIDSLSALSGAISGGSLKALAVAASERLTDHPNLPALAETVPGFRAMGWFVLMAPPKTPDQIARKVSEDLRTVVEQPDLQRRFRELGTYVRPMPQTEVITFIHEEQQFWKPVITQIGLSQKP